MQNKFYTIKLSVTNCYLLKCNNGYLLIDTGYQKDYKRFLKQLNKINIAIEDINCLLLTHHHNDHSGFINQLINKTDIQLILHENAIKLLKNGKNDLHKGGVMNQSIYYSMRLQHIISPSITFSFSPVLLRAKDVIIKDNDNALLRSLGINGKILYTPGHSLDSISVLLDDGTLFCGDAASSMLLFFRTKYCTVFNRDIEQVYKTWENLISLNVKNIYPGHGNPFKLNQLKKHVNYYRNENLVQL